jgi:F0F1-type ATP synthase delta subunit
LKRKSTNIIDAKVKAAHELKDKRKADAAKPVSDAPLTGLDRALARFSE